MRDPFYDVVLAAAELKLAAPREYEKLLVAVRLVEERCRNDLLSAEANVIFPVQGKAQLVTHLRQKLENCLQIKAETEARK